MANENWNPNNRGHQNVPTRVQNITTTVSGITVVATKLNNVRYARANYDGQGGSGVADVNVLLVSGNSVRVQFVTHSGDQQANSGIWTDSGHPVNSGYGFSGGILTVWADGD